MGKPRGTSNTRASTPTPSKQLFKKKTKCKIMKTKGKKLPIKNKIMKININDNDNMTNTAFKEELFGKLNYEEMKQKFEETSV